MASITLLGCLLGGLLASRASTTLGKRNSLALQGPPMAVGWLLIYLGPTVPYVLAGRFLTGLCGGLISGTAPSYVCEIATPANRGLLGSGFQVRTGSARIRLCTRPAVRARPAGPAFASEHRD